MMADIRFDIEKNIQVVPERIVFHTAFNFSDERFLENGIERANASLLRFLADSDIIILKKFQSVISKTVGEDQSLEYECPAYEIELTPAFYKLVERYMESHPELSLNDVAVHFSKASKQTLVNEITYQAGRKAREIADSRKRRIRADFEMQEIIPEPSKWKIKPPMSARYDHFRQTLTARYSFVFYTV